MELLCVEMMNLWCRLNHINNSLKVVLLPSVDRHYKRAIELLELLKKEYKIDENTDVNVAIF